jgi:tetratricopeptide (TPR) repeat protein
VLPVEGNEPANAEHAGLDSMTNAAADKVDRELRGIVEAALASLPCKMISPSYAESLRTPTSAALQRLGEGLLAAGCLDAAEALFAALLERPGPLPWMAAGRARVAFARGDRKGEAVAWRNCLERFSDRVQPAWLCELAIAEGTVRTRAGAAQLLRRCADRIARFAAPVSQLAVLLEDADQPDPAAWRAALRSFPTETEAGWFVTVARTLEAAGLPKERRTVLDEMGVRFANAPAGVARRAEAAAQTDDWPRALELWNELIDRQPDTAAAAWCNGRARALFRLGRIDDALAAWAELVDRAPEFVPGRLDKANALRELGAYAAALQDFDELIERFPARCSPEWLNGRAACLLQMRLDDDKIAADLERTITALDTQFPDSPLGRRVAFLRARRMLKGLESLAAIAEGAVRRFPTDRWLLAEWVPILLAEGRGCEAEAVVRRLEDGADDHWALISRWHLALDRSGGAAIVAAVRRSLSRGNWNVGPALAVASFLLLYASLWLKEPVLTLLESLAAEHPGQTSIHVLWARALITLRRDDEALDVIGAIPNAYHTQEVLELRAWAHARRDEHELAREAWARILATSYLPAVHAPPPALELLTQDRRLAETDGVTVFTPIRDELPNLPWFLAHYRLLGVRRFVFIDNMSKDGSEAYLAAQPDVVVYRTRDHFREAMSGMRWINELIERHGRGGWRLFADADEAFIYPGWEQISLELLTKFLDRERAEGVAAFMLDVYPGSPISADGRLPSHADCRHYDRDYTWIGHIRPPYVRPLGGVRVRLFGTQEYLHKVPLIKSDRTIYIENHETPHLKLASITGVHLHYKLLDLVRRAAESAPGRTHDSYLRDRAVQARQRYRRYASRLAAAGALEFYAPSISETVGDSLSMAEQGLMRATPEFRRWLAIRD